LYRYTSDACDKERFPDICYDQPECFYTIPKNDACLPFPDDPATRDSVGLYFSVPCTVDSVYKYTS
jgi:hypothetical protein